MIISTDARKHQTKSKHIRDKILRKIGIRGTSTWLRASTKKSTGNIILNDKRLNDSPLRSEQGNDIRSHHCYSTQYWSSRQCNKQEKEIKGM